MRESTLRKFIPVIGEGLTPEQKIDWLTEVLVNYAKERHDLRAALTTIINAHDRYCEAMGARGWKPDNDPLFEACEAARAVLQTRT